MAIAVREILFFVRKCVCVRRNLKCAPSCELIPLDARLIGSVMLYEGSLYKLRFLISGFDYGILSSNQIIDVHARHSDCHAFVCV